jgi:hypothetical protein
MKTVAMVIVFAALTGCANARIYAFCDKRIDKDQKTHYHCDKQHMIGFGYKF